MLIQENGIGSWYGAARTPAAGLFDKALLVLSNINYVSNQILLLELFLTRKPPDPESLHVDPIIMIN